jgi:hypothetical protein
MVHAGLRAWVTGGRLLTGALFPPLRRTGVRQLSVSSSFCSRRRAASNSPVSGPVALTGERKTVDPLRVGSKELEVCLQVVGTTTDVDFERRQAASVASQK